MTVYSEEPFSQDGDGWVRDHGNRKLFKVSYDYFAHQRTLQKAKAKKTTKKSKPSRRKSEK